MAFLLMTNSAVHSLAGPPYAIPLSCPLTMTDHSSHMIKITGILDKTEIGWFNIRFRNSKVTQFLICVRPEQNVVVRNSFENDQWQAEERDGEFRFVPGKEFTMSIVCGREAYKVFLNDCFYFSFKHRCPVADAKLITFDGKVKLQTIEIVHHTTDA